MATKQTKKSHPVRIHIDYNSTTYLWDWVLQNHKGITICKSDNHTSLFGGYTRKSTAIKSAKRFAEKYLNGKHVIIINDIGNGLILKEYNGFYDPIAEDQLL